ncbi:hypothetical protein GC197_04100 [bacterium]|nr:hypothetical protein [bacterium]
MSDTATESPSQFSALRILKAIGPAIVVASVVLGPGSILSNSKVGAAYGYSMIWVLGLASVFMALTVFMAAVLGTNFERSPFTELAGRLGRPVTILTGVVFFVITSCFQFTNNVAIIDVINIATASGNEVASGNEASMSPLSQGSALASIVLINLGLVWALYGSNTPYRFIEKLMMAMVGIMLVGFVANLLFVQPSISGILSGMIPSLPSGGESTDNIVMLVGMFGTTFSIAGAFYQIYAVREKNWTRESLANGIVDSIAGIAVLGGISFIIMITSATVLQGAKLANITDVARQLEPLIGPWAKVMFCVGISAGAFSSLLVNALIGGTALSDSLGYSASVKDQPVKLLTVVGLGIGMFAAIAVNWLGVSNVTLIVTAQALTVLGVPLLAFAMLYLAMHLPASGLKVIACLIGMCSQLLAIILSGRMVWYLLEKYWWVAEQVGT